MKFDSKETEEYFNENIKPYEPFHIRNPKIKIWTMKDVTNLIELFRSLDEED